MYLTVFAEFYNKELLEQVAKETGLTVDIADKPNALATSDVEKDIVAHTAKLMIQTPPAEAKGIKRPVVEEAAVVDAMLAKLVALGFVVTNRSPVTSAGCPMVDRVLLKHGGAPVVA